MSQNPPWNLDAIRSHFVFPAHGRVVTNNAASTQPPRALLALFQALAPANDNVLTPKDRSVRDHPVPAGTS